VRQTPLLYSNGTAGDILFSECLVGIVVWVKIVILKDFSSFDQVKQSKDIC